MTMLETYEKMLTLIKGKEKSNIKRHMSNVYLWTLKLNEAIEEEKRVERFGVDFDNLMPENLVQINGKLYYRLPFFRNPHMHIRTDYVGVADDAFKELCAEIEEKYSPSIIVEPAGSEYLFSNEHAAKIIEDLSALKEKYSALANERGKASQIKELERQIKEIKGE